MFPTSGAGPCNSKLDQTSYEVMYARLGGDCLNWNSSRQKLGDLSVLASGNSTLDTFPESGFTWSPDLGLGTVCVSDALSTPVTAQTANHVNLMPVLVV